MASLLDLAAKIVLGIDMHEAVERNLIAGDETAEADLTLLDNPPEEPSLESQPAEHRESLSQESQERINNLIQQLERRHRGR